MATRDKTVHKNRMGRPPRVRYGETIPARFEIETMKHLDSWAKKHAISRSESIRRLVELGLTVKSKGHPKSEAARRNRNQRARELAGSAIDEMTDTTASADDQGNRRRRLIRGPEEFQSVRRDRPNRK
jgi:hypothetical protein